MIERNFQIPFVARMALAEKQIQQNYRPLIAVHKWFARRPGTLFRALLLSELGGDRVEQTFFRAIIFTTNTSWILLWEAGRRWSKRTGWGAR